MGWSFDCQRGRLKDFLKERTSGWVCHDGNGAVTSQTKCLTSKYVMYNPGAGVLFKVMETDTYPSKTTERWIGVDLIKCQGGCWGYKDMTEESGPNEVNCPLKYIDELVLDPGTCGRPECKDNPYKNDHLKSCTKCHGCGRCWAMNWRKRVRDFHAKRKQQADFMKSLKPGDVIIVRGHAPFEVARIDAKRKLVFTTAFGGSAAKFKDVDVAASLEAVGIPREAGGIYA